MLLLSIRFPHPFLFIPSVVLEQSHVVQIQLFNRTSLIRNLCQLLIHKGKKSWFYRVAELVKQVVLISQRLLSESMEAAGVERRRLCTALDVGLGRFYS